MATCPGEALDGTIDGKRLIAWIDQAKRHLSANDRLGIGLDRIGDVLGRTKAGDDGIWPCEAVRDAIEHASDDRLSTSVRIGRSNARGVTVRMPFAGGGQERDLAEKYRNDAAKISAKWPETARILRELAQYYERDAGRHDDDARWGDLNE